MCEPECLWHEDNDGCFGKRAIADRLHKSLFGSKRGSHGLR